MGKIMIAGAISLAILFMAATVCRLDFLSYIFVTFLNIKNIDRMQIV